jgi:hypothetical protein
MLSEIAAKDHDFIYPKEEVGMVIHLFDSLQKLRNVAVRRRPLDRLGGTCQSQRPAIDSYFVCLTLRGSAHLAIRPAANRALTNLPAEVFSIPTFAATKSSPQLPPAAIRISLRI